MKQNNSNSPSLEVGGEPALVRCPHCRKMVENVYLHTANEDCDVINEQISQLIAEGVSDDFRP